MLHYCRSKLFNGQYSSVILAASIAPHSSPSGRTTMTDPRVTARGICLIAPAAGAKKEGRTARRAFQERGQILTRSVRSFLRSSLIIFWEFQNYPL